MPITFRKQWISLNQERKLSEVFPSKHSLLSPKALSFDWNLYWTWLAFTDERALTPLGECVYRVLFKEGGKWCCEVNLNIINGVKIRSDKKRVKIMILRQKTQPPNPEKTRVCTRNDTCLIIYKCTEAWYRERLTCAESNSLLSWRPLVTLTQIRVVIKL